MTTSPARKTRGPLNELIAQYMNDKGFRSVGEFADAAQLGSATVYGLMRGPGQDGASPNLSTLVRLAEVLGRPTHELLYLLMPTAPGAPELPEDTRQQDARARLRALSASLVDSERFLADRAEEFGEAN